MSTIGYVPFGESSRSREPDWLRDYLGVDVLAVNAVPPWNHSPPRRLPPIDRLARALEPLLPLPAVLLEGPGGFLSAACLRREGFTGAVTVLPGLNPRGWRDVVATAVYQRFHDPRDRIFVGSRPSAALYAALDLQPDVGEPYGVDERIFRLRPEAERVRAELGLPAGRMLLYAGRAQRDHDLYTFLQVGLKARVLFPGLIVVVASPDVDEEYLAPVLEHLEDAAGVHIVIDPTARQLADLYNIADVFLTASTSRLETFDRATAQALICGCPTVAPRYDGFVEVLAQPGGTIVDPRPDPVDGTPRADGVGLLRAVYDVLTATHRPDREDIADVARRRFGRSTTMAVLRNLVDGSIRRPGLSVTPACLELPAAWQVALAELATQKPVDALAWCWSEAEHERLAEHDAGFQAQVRRLLWLAASMPGSMPRSAPTRSR